MEDSLQIQSITGVDVELRIAGPGGRSYAFVVDWHIRLLLALSWYVIGTLLLFGTLSVVELESANTSGFVFVVVLPASALFFLYHPVLEVLMRGRTPGKRMAGIRIVTQTGDLPGVGAILIRNVLRLVDSLPGVYAVGLTAVVLTDQSVRIGDMAAGTLLVYDDDEQKDPFSESSSQAIASLGLENLQLVEELIGRWPDLDPEVRINLGRTLLTRLGCEAAGDEAEISQSLRRLAREGI